MKKSILNKNTSQKVREEIKRNFKIATALKQEPLTKEEKEKVKRETINEHNKKKNFIRAGIAAIVASLGIGIGIGKLLPSGKNESQVKNQQEVETDEVKNNAHDEFVTKVSISPEDLSTETINYDKIIEENLINDYNEKYNTDLTQNDLAYIKSNPQFLMIDDNGNYIQNYKETLYQKNYTERGIKDIYVVINTRDNTIISSLGEAEYELANIDTKIVKNSQGIEYVESDKKIDLTENKNQEQIKQIYDALQNEYEKANEIEER